MSTKEITDEQVIRAFIKVREQRNFDPLLWPYDILMEETGQCLKVCFRAMERAEKRGYLDYGVSLRSGWVTQKGEALLIQNQLASVPWVIVK